MEKEIPEISLQRLPVYLNYLRSLPESEGTYISSGAIASALGMGEVLVRKDLAYTKATGKPKVGYVREELVAALEEFLCCNNKKNAVIIGIGGLGRALLGYGGFKNYGIDVVAAFDKDEEKIGTFVADKPVLDINGLEGGLKEHAAQLAIICVPASAAQSVADMLSKVGVKAILNFAPVQLSVPKGVIVRNIDVAGSLSVLAAMIK